jgi:hypothetical protein
LGSRNSLRADEPTEFQCLTSGSRPPARIQWFQLALDDQFVVGSAIDETSPYRPEIGEQIIELLPSERSASDDLGAQSQQQQRLSGARESISAQLNSTLSTLAYLPVKTSGRIRLVCRAENPSTGAFLQDSRDLIVHCKSCF